MVILKQIRVFRIIPLLIVVCFSSLNAHAKYGGGTGNPDDPYLIYTAEQINSIGAEPNDWDKHFRLMEDIDLSAYTEKLFNIIGNPSMPFKGVFDGNNYTISNFNYSGITAYAGIFGTVESGEIRDLHLIDPNVQVDGYVKNTAPLVGWLDNGTVSNCSVDNSNVFGSSQVGGLIGWSSFGSTIRDCTVNGAVSGENRIGGIAGRNDGTIKNCHFSGEVSATESQIGGFVGFNYKGTITDCTVSAHIFGEEQVGGFVGAQESSRITGCGAAGSVTGSVEAGGFIGGNNGIIANCYTMADVFGTTYVGGFAGQNGLHYGGCVVLGGWISNCYTRGRVVGEENAGGLVGYNDRHGTINNCFATGIVSGATEVGGLIGHNHEGDVITSFWDIETSSLSSSAAGTPKTTAQMQDPNMFVRSGWDFAGQQDGPHDIWDVPEEGGYPILSWQLSPLPLLSAFSVGTGEPNDPYLITTAEELNRIGHNPRLMDAHFRLVADIDLANVNFFMIGDNSLPFSGVFDGHGKRIFNFSNVVEETSLSSIDEHSVGLFNCVSGGEIINLGIIDPNIDTSNSDWTNPEWMGTLICWLRGGSVASCYVRGGNVAGSGCVGGLVAKNLNGTIIDCHTSISTISGDGVGGLVGDNTGNISDCYSNSNVSGKYGGGLVGGNSKRIFNCYATGNVSASNNGVGGLAGSNSSSGEIICCYATGNVTGRHAIGGLVGYNRGLSTFYATIANCYATGKIEGIDNVGGLVAYNSVGVISNCYSQGSVLGSDNVGGLVGYLGSGEVSYCYSTGIVTGTKDTGGVVGIQKEGSVNLSFWDIQTSSVTESAGGEGKTTAEMQTATIFLDAGWDFVGETDNGTEDNWWILEGQDYPRLWWETPVK